MKKITQRMKMEIFPWNYLENFKYFPSDHHRCFSYRCMRNENTYYIYGWRCNQNCPRLLWKTRQLKANSDFLRIFCLIAETKLSNQTRQTKYFLRSKNKKLFSKEFTTRRWYLKGGQVTLPKNYFQNNRLSKIYSLVKILTHCAWPFWKKREQKFYYTHGPYI